MNYNEESTTVRFRTAENGHYSKMPDETLLIEDALDRIEAEESINGFELLEDAFLKNHDTKSYFDPFSNAKD